MVECDIQYQSLFFYWIPVPLRNSTYTNSKDNILTLLLRWYQKLQVKIKFKKKTHKKNVLKNA